MDFLQSFISSTARVCESVVHFPLRDPAAPSSTAYLRQSWWEERPEGQQRAGKGLPATVRGGILEPLPGRLPQPWRSVRWGCKQQPISPRSPSRGAREPRTYRDEVQLYGPGVLGVQLLKNPCGGRRAVPRERAEQRPHCPPVCPKLLFLPSVPTLEKDLHGQLQTRPGSPPISPEAKGGCLHPNRMELGLSPNGHLLNSVSSRTRHRTKLSKSMMSSSSAKRATMTWCS